MHYCTHCQRPGTDDNPVESVGEAGESGGGSMVYAHPGCLPPPRSTAPSHALGPSRSSRRS